MSLSSSPSRPWSLPALAIGIALVCYLYPQHAWKTYRNVNEQARLYLVKAIVEEGVVNIDSGIKIYGDLQDKAVRGDHFYCDKPIGLSLVAVPVYALLYNAGRLIGYHGSLQAMRYALTVTCVSLPAIFLLVLLARYWSGLGGSPGLVALGILAYALGSIAFTYSTQFVGHQLAAVVAFSHFFLSRSFTGRVAWWKLLLAGALAGFGAITDYFSALLHVAIVLSYVSMLRPAGSWIPFLVGGAAAFSPLPIYNFVAFGSPAKMSYGQEALPVFKELHGTGFFGVTLPRLESIEGLLISPAKGLFWLSPFLILGVVGIAAAVRGRQRRSDAVLMASCVAIITWLACSVVDWRAGWTVGPRHMVSMLPFLATGAVLAVLRFPRLGGALAVAVPVSIAMVFVPTLTLPAFDVNFVNPCLSQSVFLLSRGLVSSNLGQLLGLPGAWSLAIPGALVAVGLAYAVRRFRDDRPGRLDPVSMLVPAVVMAAAGWLLLRVYPEPPAPATMYFQARVLKLVDQPLMAASRFEEAVADATDPSVRRQVAARAYPEAAAIYGQLGDLQSVDRIVASWARVDPSNPVLGQLRNARSPAASVQKTSP